MPDEVTMRTKFQNRFNELLKGHTQESLARKIGISRPTVGLYASAIRLW